MGPTPYAWLDTAQGYSLSATNGRQWRRADAGVDTDHDPRHFACGLRVGAQQLAGAAARLARYASHRWKDRGFVRLTPQRGMLRLSVPDNEESSTATAAHWECTPAEHVYTDREVDAMEYATTVNAGFLAAAVAGLSGVVELRVTSSTLPLVLMADAAPGWQAVIMPVRMD